MSEQPEPIHLRARAAESVRLRRRRRRRLGTGAVFSALVSVVAAAAMVLTAAGPARRGAAAVPVAHRMAPRRARPRSAAATTALAVRGTAAIRRLAALGLPVYCAGPRGNAVAFTFDDGPGPYTHYAIRKLTRAHERATFFVVGRSMRRFPGWIERETAIAALGDHTMTHPYLPGLAAAAIDAELARPQAMIQAALGRPVVLFRPPYGARDATVDATARRLGMLEVLWSVDSRDSLGANWARIIRNVEAGLRPGTIILMHENRGQTIRALTALLPELRRRHLRSVTLPELFATDPPSVAQLREGVRACGTGAAARTGS